MKHGAILSLLLAFISLFFGCKFISKSDDSGGESKTSNHEGVPVENCRDFYFDVRYPDRGKITANQPVTLEWSVPGYTQVEIEGVTERLNQPYGTRIVTPVTTTTYRLKAYKNPDEQPAIFETLVGVEKVGGPSVIRNLRTQFPSVKPNEVTGIYWQVSGCSKVMFEGSDRRDVWECLPHIMSTTVAMPVTTDFVLTIYDSLDRVLETQIVTLVVQP